MRGKDLGDLVSAFPVGCFTGVDGQAAGVEAEPCLARGWVGHSCCRDLVHVEGVVDHRGGYAAGGEEPPPVRGDSDHSGAVAQGSEQAVPQPTFEWVGVGLQRLVVV